MYLGLTSESGMSWSFISRPMQLILFPISSTLLLLNRNFCFCGKLCCYYYAYVWIFTFSMPLFFSFLKSISMLVCDCWVVGRGKASFVSDSLSGFRWFYDRWSLIVCFGFWLGWLRQPGKCLCYPANCGLWWNGHLQGGGRTGLWLWTVHCLTLIEFASWLEGSGSVSSLYLLRLLAKIACSRSEMRTRNNGAVCCDSIQKKSLYLL